MTTHTNTNANLYNIEKKEETNDDVKNKKITKDKKRN